MIGWPTDKPAQKNKAQNIAAESKLETLHYMSAEETQSHVGDYVTVEAVVSETHKTQRGILLLNFGGSYPNQLLTSWIEKPDSLTNSTLPDLTGKSVRIVGKVQMYKGKLEITIKSKDQLHW